MTITHIVLHYSATYEDQNIGVREIDAMHKARGWSGIGYHYVIRLDGTVETGRAPETRIGSHVGGQNRGKIGICHVGGLRRATGPNVGVDTRTPRQIAALKELVRDILSRHPGARVTGHRDLAATQCPAYDAAAWWASVTGEVASGKPPAAEAPAVSWPTQRLGSRGQYVKALQQALVRQGHSLGSIDGNFGPMTASAVRAFQTRFQLVSDGIVGPTTWIALLT